MDDAELVARVVKNGDQAACELIVRRYTPKVWKEAIRLLKDPGEAEEAVQDTFVKAFRKLDSFRFESSLSTWLVSICHNHSVDQLEAKARRPNVLPIDEIHERAQAGRYISSLTIQGPEEQALNRLHLRQALQRALQSLAPDPRQAFCLIAVDGLSREEAAALVGVPASTMRSRFAAARRRILQAFAQDPAAPDPLGPATADDAEIGKQ